MVWSRVMEGPNGGRVSCRITLLSGERECERSESEGPKCECLGDLLGARNQPEVTDPAKSGRELEHMPDARDSHTGPPVQAIVHHFV
jgi:hypothetical protein